MLNSNVSSRSMTGQELFLRILVEHELSDVTIVCSARTSPEREVQFYCHSDVLRRCCSLFADAAQFECLSGAAQNIQAGQAASERKPQRFELWADDDVVFEVLRYVYCGAVYFHLGFHTKFAQFLSVVDFLGIEDMAERNALNLGLREPGCGNVSGDGQTRLSIFAEPGIKHWLQHLHTEDVLNFLRDDLISGTLENEPGAMGFSILRSFLTKLIELRPQDFTVEVLGNHLYDRLAAFGCSHSSSSSHRGKRKSMLQLPGPLVFVDLSRSRAQSVNLAGLDPISTAVARLSPLSQPSPQSSGTRAPDAVQPAQAGTADSEAASATRRSQARLWHQGQILPEGVCRESLLQDGQQPQQAVVVFGESLEGHHVFETSLRRALSRNAAEQQHLAKALDSLVRTARSRSEAPMDDDVIMTQEGSNTSSSHGSSRPWRRPVDLTFSSHHDVLGQLDFCRDFDDRQEPLLRVCRVLHGSAAEHAGLEVGWLLTGHSRTSELAFSAPIAGQAPIGLSPTTLEWVSLSSLYVTITSPVEQTVSLLFEERPFGFSWTQEGEHIVIKDLKSMGRASSFDQLSRGMILKSFQAGSDGEPITRLTKLVEALRGHQAPATLTFGWRQCMKTVAANAFVGVRLEEKQLPAGGTGVFIADIPSSHPAHGQSVGPGWQLLGLQEGPHRSRNFTHLHSLTQLPAQFFNHAVTMNFQPPPPLYEFLPLDRFHGTLCPYSAEDSVTRSTSAELPWCELLTEPCNVGSLSGVRLRRPPWAAQAQQSPGPAKSYPSCSTMPTNRIVQNLDGSEQVWEAFVLGQFPVFSRGEDHRIRAARIADPIAWELRQALESIGPIQQSTPPCRISVVALRRCSEHLPASGEATEDAGQAEPSSWLGGVLLGESAQQVLYRWSLYLLDQERAAMLGSSPGQRSAAAEGSSVVGDGQVRE